MRYSLLCKPRLKMIERCQKSLSDCRNTIENSFMNRSDPETLINLSVSCMTIFVHFVSWLQSKEIKKFLLWEEDSRASRARVSDIQGILLFSLKGVFEINNSGCHFQYRTIICLNTLFAPQKLFQLQDNITSFLYSPWSLTVFEEIRKFPNTR